MVSRSSKDKTREERVLVVAGCIPPVRCSTLKTDDF